MEAEETLPADDLTDVQPPLRTDEVPREIGRYTIIDRVGTGGSGVVFSAYDPNLDRRIALKLLNRRTRSSARLKEMLQEAQALARLSHPNVITVHDAEVFDDRVYVAMDFVEGGTLREWLEDLPASDQRWRRVLPVLCGAGRGLAAAHEAGMVHRDFKPQNVLVDAQDDARVVDFGLALDRITSVSSESRSSERPGRLTGTPAYLAPELYEGETATPASDQFAFCVTAFEALFGYRPFTGDTTLTLMTAITQGRLTTGDRGFGVPVWLKSVILRGVEVKPEDRWPSMDALLEALEQDPVARRRRWLWMSGLGASLVAVGVMAGVAGTREEAQCEDATARLAGIWDADRKAALRSQYEASGLSFATPTANTVEATLDAYAQAWVQGDRDVCEAELADRLSEDLRSRRLACLQSRRLALEVATDMLLEGDASLLTRGIRIADTLPAVDQCAQAATLLAGRTAPDDEVIPEIRQIEDELAALRVQWSAGKTDNAKAELDRLVERAKEVDYPPTLAEIYLLRADVFELEMDDGADHTVIERDLRAAWEAGLAGDDDVVAARAAVALIDYYNVGLLRFDDGELWEAFAASSVDRLERRGLEVATDLREDIRLLEGKTLLRKHQHEDAVALLGEVFRQREEKYGADHMRTTDARSWFANALQASQQFDPAAELYRDNLELYQRRYGKDHPQVGGMANNVGLMLRHANRLEEGRELLEFARDSAERNFGKNHYSYTMACSNLAEACFELGDKDCALENYRAAFPERIRKQTIGIGMLSRVGKYAGVLYNREEYDEAKSVAQWLRWSSEAADAADYVYTGLYMLGRVELRRGNAEAGLEYLTRAVTARELTGPAKATLDVLIASALLRRGEPGDVDSARQRLHRAVILFGDEDRWSDERSALRGWLDDPDPTSDVADTVLGDW